MESKISKNDDASDSSVQNLPENVHSRSTDNVSMCTNKDDETKSNDFKQFNDTVLDMPLPRIEKVKRTAQHDRRINLFGFYKSESRGNPRITWVQSMLGKHMIQAEGIPFEYDPHSRNDFVKKVFFILTIMMFLTLFIVMLIYITPLKRIFITHGIIIIVPALIIVVAMSYAFACSSCTRKPPCNYICLVLVVVSMSMICTFVTVRYDTQIIVCALLATIVAVAVCTMLAFTKFDFTSWILYVVMISLALSAITLVFAIACLGFGFYMKPIHILITVAGLLINCVMLVIELQMVLGGKAVELTEDDYALGAFLLYMSIIEIFLHFVQLFGLLGQD